MSSIVVGTITFVSETIDGKEVYRGTLPSGAPCRITDETIISSNEPAYISGKKTSILNKYSDPADIAALTAFYDAAPTALAPLREERELAASAAANPPVETPTTTTDAGKPTTGAADDDNGGKSKSTESVAKDASKGVDKTTASNDKTKTLAGQAGESPAQEISNGKSVGLPNRRPYNPLGDFSSYNYQISLYMVTPEASNRFVMSGEKQVGNAQNGAGVSDGFYLVAQSGGINDTKGQGLGGNKRAPGFDLDFYIDDLRFKTMTTTRVTGNSSAASIDFEFNIYEPLGLSLTSKLTTAAKTIQASSKLPGFGEADNALSQFYVLGVRFFGYDKNGELVTADKYAGADENNKSSTSALFERFYPIKIKTFKFKLDGKTTVYNVTGACLSIQESFGSKRGQVEANTTCKGGTVKEMLMGGKKGITGLFEQMNAQEKKQAEDRKKLSSKSKKTQTILYNEYSVDFEPNSGIDTALMVDTKEFSKNKVNASMGDVSKTKDSNAGAEKKNVAADKNSRSFTIPGGTHIIAAIEQVIKQSSYIKNMMTEVESSLSDEDPVKNSNPAEVAWFSITPGIEIKGFDTVLNDYCYNITYYIQKYKIPFVRTALVSKTSTYPGPHKKYEYWYTGKNTEVISYEQQFNNLYFLTGVGDGYDNPNSQSIPKKDKPQPANNKGEANKALEAVNALAVDLFDPSSIVQSKMTILGDPDYLSQTVGSSLDDIYNKFYGPDGYTINPNGGQVFIELDFQTATDYDFNGLLSINNNIRFMEYKDPGLKQAIKGITFELKWITSTFSKGKFTQELDLMPATSLDKFDKPAHKQPTKDETVREKPKTKQKARVDLSSFDSGSGGNSWDKPKKSSDIEPSNYDTMGNYTGDYVSTATTTTTTRDGKQIADDDNSGSGHKLKATTNKIISRANQEAANRGPVGRGGGTRK